MRGDGFARYSIKFQPSPLLRHTPVAFRVRFRLGMDPYKRGTIDTLFPQNGEFLQCRRAGGSMGSNNQTRSQVRLGGGPDKFLIHSGQWCAIHADFDESGPDARIFDALRPFQNPTGR